MDRRTFIKTLGLGAGALAFPGYGWTQPIGYDGPLFIHISAPGGWDTTLFCDPKGRLNAAEVNPRNRTYHRDDIETPGQQSPIIYAPTDFNRRFFGRYYDRLLVLNGIDLASINHGTGVMEMGSGVGTGVNPSIAALLAASRAPNLGLTFWDAGGFSVTHSHVVRTRVSESDRLAFLTTPNQGRLPGQVDLLMQPRRDFDRAMALVRRRAERRAQHSRLPQLRTGLVNFARSHQPGQGLDQLIPFLPRPQDIDAMRYDMTRQIVLGAASYQAGLTCAMVVRGPGAFDSHDLNDTAASDAFTSWLDAVDESWQYIEQIGLADRTIFYMTSELGRTPNYNAGDGKDHWPVTSAMLMGAGIRGNRLIGASTHDQLPRRLDPNTLAVTDNEAVGVLLRPSHIHAELRHLLGITDSPLSQRYELDTERLGIL